MKESERVQPATVPDLNLGSGDFGGNWYARDLAYGADSLIENLAGEMDRWEGGFAVGLWVCYFCWIVCLLCCAELSCVHPLPK